MQRTESSVKGHKELMTKKKMNKRKKMMGDMCLNIVASTIPIAVLQLVVYPMTAKNIGGDNYGLMLTIYSCWMMISSSLGNSINSVRLLHNREYEEENISGDFNILLRKWVLVDVILIFALTIFYCGGFNIKHISLSVIVSVLLLIRSYTEVGFRLKLNYVAIVINNILQAMGFLVGAYLAKVTGLWELIFIFGYTFACIYSSVKTGILREKNIKTKFFGKTQRDMGQLFLSNLISNTISYADKLVLYPIMGGVSVAIYYTATILGKMVAMLTGPINSVILSYISVLTDVKKNILGKVLIIGMGICIIGYFVVLLISRPVMDLLFPQWTKEVMLYIPVTTANAMLTVLISIISPFVVKFCDMKWQIVINAIGAGTYFIVALILLKAFGLMGFCFGAVIGTITRLATMIIVYYKN